MLYHLFHNYFNIFPNASSEMCISSTWTQHFVEVLTSYRQPETVYYAPASKNSILFIAAYC